MPNNDVRVSDIRESDFEDSSYADTDSGEDLEEIRQAQKAVSQKIIGCTVFAVIVIAFTGYVSY